MNKKILVTGASGFIGRNIVYELLSQKNPPTIYTLVRKPANFPATVIQILCDDISYIDRIDIPWGEINLVIHLAARAHIPQKKSASTLDEFRRVNSLATEMLAEKCAAAGVSRFIFMSSIGVLGSSSGHVPFTETTSENPQTDYAISKLEAERSLKAISKKHSMDYTIIRPPLVIGLEAPGNFNLLLKIIKKGIPLPFSLITNRRNFILCENLVKFIILCSLHQNAKNETFLIADDPAMSTPELAKSIAIKIKKNLFLIPVPVPVLRLIAKIFSRESTCAQLCDSLEIDFSKAKNMLGWKSPLALNDFFTLNK